jgi:ankyrin repeat domain-containing protein 50
MLRLPPGTKLQEDIQRWLSPPDPWKNHNTARESRNKGTSTWFLEGTTFAKWKSPGPDSLLWIHGKRECLSPTPFHFC